MISMTTYWQQFKDCIDNLQPAAEDGIYSNQIITANSMTQIGLTIEQLGLFEAKKIANNLHEIAKKYDHEVSFTSDIEYRFNLPKIVNTESLVFAINYYQHLTNYENVNYQGVINWGRQFVVNGINEKKIITRIQSQAMLEEIKQYCKSQNIPINEPHFLKTKNEKATDYIKRISGIIKIDNSEIKEVKVSSKPDELVKLEQLREELNDKKNQLKIKSDCFFKKLTEFDQAKQTYSILNKEWQNKWLITRVFYWVISWVYNVPLIKNLKMAQEQLIKAENELNQELPPKTSESYRAELKKQLDEIDIAYENTQQQINLQIVEQMKQPQIKLEQTKPIPIQLEKAKPLRIQLEKTKPLQIQLEQTKPQEIQSEQAKPQAIQLEQAKPLHIQLEQLIPPQIQLEQAIQQDDEISQQETFYDSDVPETELETEDEDLSSNINFYYGFFKENLPSRQTMGAIAVGTAAIIIQNLTYS